MHAWTIRSGLETEPVNPDLDKLFAYPFVRLERLLATNRPPANLAPISLTIGEPRHAPPAAVLAELAAAQAGYGSYPMALGLSELRDACVAWLQRRYALPDGMLDPDQHVLPVSGTREALFAFAQAVVDRTQAKPKVLLPNPFYQIYEGAALLAGAEPVYLATRADTGWLPDLDAVEAATWRDCQLLYLCSPGNPTGAVMDEAYLARALALADKYDFVIAADECYAELYLDEAQPPPGILQVCANTGRQDLRRVVAFHSLSKRSNVPGLRSGFVAGDADIMRAFLLYRTYHGCAMPLPAQAASVVAWRDDKHVRENRALYREKFARVVPLLAPVLDFAAPTATFYLWVDTGVDDEVFTKALHAQQNVRVLPGQYLSRGEGHDNPGRNKVRISLVASVDECVEAAQRIRKFIESA